MSGSRPRCSQRGAPPLDGELAKRRRRGVELNLKFARFPCLKRLDDFDFAAQPSVDRRLVDELATGRFTTEGRNLVLLGPPGVGKTHLAIALAVRVAELGRRVYFTTAVDLARRLAKATAESRLHRELKNLVRPSLLFQVLCQRYEKGQSVVLTSNKPFAEWAEVFAGDAVMASAALDRLLHRAAVLNIRGESYRLLDRRLANSREPPTPGQPQRERREPRQAGEKEATTD